MSGANASPARSASAIARSLKKGRSHQEMLADLLRSGFALAHRRLGLLFIDALWKVIWVVLTAGALFLTVLWITSGLQAIEWEDTGVPALNGLIVGFLLREFWNANRGGIITTGFTLLCISALIWVFLEAVFRRKIVRYISNQPHPFMVFLVSGFLKLAVLSTAAAVLGPVFRAGAGVIAVVTFLAVLFLLTLFESLIRADAVDLLGTDLIRVAGLLAILMSLEGMVVTSLIAILGAGLLNVAGRAEALVMLAGAAVAGVFLSVLHSYLLLVRFSAIVIMRQNVVDV